MEIGLLLLVVLILFGPKRLPQLGKSLGKSIKAMRDGIDGKGAIEPEDETEVPAPKKADKTAVSADDDEASS